MLLTWSLVLQGGGGVVGSGVGGVGATALAGVNPAHVFLSSPGSHG